MSKIIAGGLMALHEYIPAHPAGKTDAALERGRGSVFLTFSLISYLHWREIEEMTLYQFGQC